VWLFHGNQYSKKIETFRLLESLPNSLSPWWGPRNAVPSVKTHVAPFLW
jgi:hypothetical protein